MVRGRCRAVRTVRALEEHLGVGRVRAVQQSGRPAAQAPVEEGRHIAPGDRGRARGGEGRFRVLDAELLTDLGEVGEGEVPGVPDRQPPLEAVQPVPGVAPGLVDAGAVPGVGAQHQERPPVQPPDGSRVEERAVHVDPRVHPAVRGHRGGGRVAPDGVARHAHPPRVDRPRVPPGRVRAGQPVQQEREVVGPPGGDGGQDLRRAASSGWASTLSQAAQVRTRPSGSCVPVDSYGWSAVATT